MITELHSVCTVIPIIVGPNANSEQWQSFVANFMPGLQNKFTKDPDFNGAFYANSFADLQSEQLYAHLNNCLCLVENRATCRTVVDAWQPPKDEDATAGDPTEGFRGLDDYENDAPEAIATDAPGTE